MLEYTFSKQSDADSFYNYLVKTLGALEAAKGIHKQDKKVFLPQDLLAPYCLKLIEDKDALALLQASRNEAKTVRNPELPAIGIHHQQFQQCDMRVSFDARTPDELQVVQHRVSLLQAQENGGISVVTTSKVRDVVNAGFQRIFLEKNSRGQALSFSADIETDPQNPNKLMLRFSNVSHSKAEVAAIGKTFSHLGVKNVTLGSTKAGFTMSVDSTFFKGFLRAHEFTLGPEPMTHISGHIMRKRATVLENITNASIRYLANAKIDQAEQSIATPTRASSKIVQQPPAVDHKQGQFTQWSKIATKCVKGAGHAAQAVGQKMSSLPKPSLARK